MRKRILIYDDDTEILSVCRTILEKDFEVEVKTNCDHVLDDIETLSPNLILMDLWIPKIGGEKAISLIKENENTRGIPVILFSANDETVKISKRAKADGYLKKPFDIIDFRDVIISFAG